MVNIVKSFISVWNSPSGENEVSNGSYSMSNDSGVGLMEAIKSEIRVHKLSLGGLNSSFKPL